MAIELTTATVAELSGIKQSLGVTSINYYNLFPEAYVRSANLGQILGVELGSVIDFKFFPKLKRLNTASGSGTWVGTPLTTILNANVLTDLEDEGTTIALNFAQANFSAPTLNQLFTDLPATTKTATIRVTGNPGAATCDTSIATNKGYTVVTS